MIVLQRQQHSTYAKLALAHYLLLSMAKALL